jgi:hypothetical protein
MATRRSSKASKASAKGRKRIPSVKRLEGVRSLKCVATSTRVCDTNCLASIVPD